MNSDRRWKELFGPPPKAAPVPVQKPPPRRAIAGDEHGFLQDIGNASHRPLLLMALGATRDSEHPVLELGMGYGSTPFLANYCRSQQRPLHSFDNNAEWCNKFQDLDGDCFVRNVCPDWDNAPLEQDWSVALVDHAPENRRHVDIKRLANRAAIIVIHDTEPEATAYMLGEIWHLFQYRADIVTERPYADSSVVSNFIDVTAWRGTKFDGYPYEIT